MNNLSYIAVYNDKIFLTGYIVPSLLPIMFFTLFT